MKKLYFFLLLFSPTIIFAQPYFNDGSKWIYGFMPNDTVNYIQIEKTGETWMNGKFCDELKFSTFYFPQGPNPMVNFHYTYSSGDTVYIYSSSAGMFGVLYNFTLAGGDSVTCILASGSMVIDSVNQVVLGPLSLETQYYTVGQYTLMTYEKIGNTGYFIPDFNSQSPMSPGWQLHCYSDSTGLSYSDGTSDCGLLSSIVGSESIGNDIKFSNGLVTCNAIQPGSEISICDITGKIVSTVISRNQYSCAVDISSNENGLYIITIRNDNQFLAEKFILLRN